MAPLFLCVQRENFSEVLAIFQGVKEYICLFVTIPIRISLLLSFPLMCKNLYKRIFCLENSRFHNCHWKGGNKVKRLEQHPFIEKPCLSDPRRSQGPAERQAHRRASRMINCSILNMITSR